MRIFLKSAATKADATATDAVVPGGWLWRCHRANSVAANREMTERSPARNLRMADRTSTPGSLKQRHWVDIVHSPTAAWLILLVSLVITAAAWQLSTRYAADRAYDRFRFQVEEAQFSIKKRMLEYEQMLRGGVGLFNSARSVTRAMWHEYVSTLELDKHFPGVQGVGFSAWIRAADKAAHIASVRAEGFSEYTLKPEGERSVYSAIVYLEPFAGRNLRAFGYDMFSEPTRREAMGRARDTGDSALSGRVTLVQETTKDIQAGFLMYLPVYQRPAQTLEERQAGLIGFVYSPFRIGDLMQGILGGGSPELDFEIYDGETVDTNALLYDSTRLTPTADSLGSVTFSDTERLQIAGRTWTIQFSSTEAFDAANATSQPLVIAFGGAAIDLLLFFIVLSLARLRDRAQRLAEEMVQQLGERELQFQAIADTAADGIVTANSLGLITYFNKAAQDTFGYGEAEAIGQPLVMLLPDAYRAQHLTAFSRFTETGVSRLMGKTLELEGRRKDGVIFPLEISLSTWNAGAARYVNAMVRDITERKKIDRMKSEFVSTVSHELRTPLTSIRGALGLVANGVMGNLSEQAKGLLNLANNNAERLARLINDILDIERLEFGQLRLAVKRHSLTTLLQQAVDSNEAMARQAGVQLCLQASPDAQVDVDQDRFLQVMTNLIANAVKFSSTGQAVSIEAQVRGARVQVRVVDHGTGIPEEFRDRIFTKFAQADSTDTRAKGGTGLGLSITKALVEMFGGQIDYESVVGQGTTFCFDLPVAESAQPSSMAS
jgi:PAS domain S-box-containing protein